MLRENEILIKDIIQSIDEIESFIYWIETLEDFKKDLKRKKRSKEI